jgi:Fuc2NAc and GlcNAc transferase
MNVLTLLLLVLVVFPIAANLAWVVMGYAARRNMLDVPGERSLHAAPTPRGGGLAIAVCVLAGAVMLVILGQIPLSLGLALVSGGIVVTVLGWLDDRRGLPAAVRAGGYLVAAALGTWFSGGLPAVTIGSTTFAPGWAGMPVAILGIAWLTNLYNFMDGADGIAAVQGISAGAFAAALFAMSGFWGAAALCTILASACAGFLIFNLPPARLFMGDAGSCLLGYSFGMLALHGEQTGAVPLPAWLLLLLVFIIDASLTLARRMLRREKWYIPHRTHAYQLLVQSGLGHRGLLIRFALINLLLLGPLALFAVRYDALPATAAATAIIACVFWYGIQRRFGAN